jgi:hypothetical protein
MLGIEGACAGTAAIPVKKKVAAKRCFTDMILIVFLFRNKRFVAVKIFHKGQDDRSTGQPHEDVGE